MSTANPGGREPSNHELIPTMAKKYLVLKRTAVAVVSVVAVVSAFVNFSLPSQPSSSDLSRFSIPYASRQLFREEEQAREFPGNPNFPGQPPRVKVYMYDLPKKFNYGIIEVYAIARGGIKEPIDDVTTLKYPGHQHMHEWYLFSDLNRPESERLGSPVIRVTDPAEADLFYVPVFSSLSLNAVRSSDPGSGSGYSDEEMQESLLDWLEGQHWWERNNGRDHVIVAGDPNALHRVLDRVKNAVLLVSDFGRLRPDQGSLVKDVVIPYSHRVNPFNGEIGVEDRSTLLFFMGNRYRKDGGKVRDLLFQVLENEEDVIIKHGTQSRENRRAATKGMHTSKFCLNPAGDTPSACRLFDSIVSLCVPVIVSDSIELPFEDVIDYTQFSIFVESNAALEPGFLVQRLRKVKQETILQYQKEMRKVKRYFDYTDPNGAVSEIWRQISQKLPLIKLMSNREKRLVMRNSTETNCSCLCPNQTGIITSI